MSIMLFYQIHAAKVIIFQPSPFKKNFEAGKTKLKRPKTVFK